MFWRKLRQTTDHKYLKETIQIFGDVIWRGKLKHLMTTGKIFWRIDRGRQKENIFIAFCRGDVSAQQLIHAGNRRLWKSMIAHACRRGTWWWNLWLTFLHFCLKISCHIFLNLDCSLYIEGVVLCCLIHNLLYILLPLIIMQSFQESLFTFLLEF